MEFHHPNEEIPVRTPRQTLSVAVGGLVLLTFGITALSVPALRTATDIAATPTATASLDDTGPVALVRREHAEAPPDDDRAATDGSTSHGRSDDRSETRQRSRSAGDDGPRREVRVEDDRIETRTREDVQGTRTYRAGDAGAVTLTHRDGELTLDDATAAAGWTVQVQQAAGRQLEVRFETPDRTRRVDVRAELEHGLVKVKVKERER